MKSNTKKWIEKFNQELIRIQTEFNAFFAKGKIDDYYNLEVDEKVDVVKINISKSNELPKEIGDALSEAFIKFQPEQ